MNKHFKVLSSSLLAGTIALSTLSPSLVEAKSIASNTEKTENKTQLSSKLTEKQINVMDQYIKLNSKGEYEIDSSVDIYKLLSRDEAKSVLKSIKDANNANHELLNRSKSAPGNVSSTGKTVVLSVTDNQFNSKKNSGVMSAQKAAYTSGVTKIKSYWWGYKVYLSKYVVNTAGGAAIGAAGFVTSKLKVSNAIGLAIAAGLGAAGFIGTNVPYGVELRLNKTFLLNTIRFVPTGVKYQKK